MPSPLYIRLQSLQTAFKHQWSNEARETVLPILQSNFFHRMMTVFIFSIILQVLTGLLLSLHFIPSSSPFTTETGKPATVEIASKVMLDAEGDTLAFPGELIVREATSSQLKPAVSYLSVKKIEASIALNTIRMIHRINTHVLLLTILSIMMMFILHIKHTQWMKGMWFIFILIATCFTLGAWTGYILPWDQFSSTSYAIVHGFIEQSLKSFGMNDLFPKIGVHGDSISKVFSIHALIIPFLIICLFRFVYHITKIHLDKTNNRYGYGLLILVIVSGLISSLEPTLHSPSDALSPTIISISPAWFFQPLHGIVQTLPADGGLTVIIFALIAFVSLPFITSFRLRMTVLAIITIATVFFALAY